MQTISEFLLGYSSDSDALITALKKAGLSKDHFIMDQRSGVKHINTDDTLLKATLATNIEGDLNTYFLYYDSNLIASTSNKTGPSATQQYCIMRVHTDKFSALPASLIGTKEAKEKSSFEIDLDFSDPNYTTPKYDRYPNWYLVELAKSKNTDTVNNVISEAIKRAVEKPALKWVLDGVMKACPHAKDKIELEYAKAIKNRDKDNYCGFVSGFLVGKRF